MHRTSAADSSLRLEMGRTRPPCAAARVSRAGWRSGLPADFASRFIRLHRAVGVLPIASAELA